MAMISAKTKVLWAAIGALNLALVVCVAGQIHVVRQLSAERQELASRLASAESEYAEQLLANVDAGESRVAQREAVISKLRDEVAHLTEALAESAAAESAASAYYDAEGHTGVSDFTQRPNVDDIPILSDIEFAELRRRRGRIPNPIDLVLINGDVDAVLADEQWNPTGRGLPSEARRELAGILSEYKFFTRLSKEDRFQNVIVPLVESLRASGSYIEYPSDGPPPRIEGASITHSEPTEDPAVFRLYPFFERDYPELYHARKVEYQRSLEMYVRAYELINGE